MSIETLPVSGLVLEPSFYEIKKEALFFRKLLENCDKEETRLITEDFPEMSCVISSMLFIYHLLTLWPDIEVFGVNGRAVNSKGKEKISHYWIEVGNVAIDLTADQYNDIDDIKLNEEIIRGRPYQSVYVGERNSIFPPKLFHIADRDEYTISFSSVTKEFLDSLEIDYLLLMRERGRD